MTDEAPVNNLCILKSIESGKKKKFEISYLRLCPVFSNKKEVPLQTKKYKSVYTYICIYSCNNIRNNKN